MTSSLLPTSAHFDLAQQLHQSGSRRNGKVARLPWNSDSKSIA
jgi:hypothetical protein